MDGLHNTVYEVDTEAIPSVQVTRWAMPSGPAKRPLRRESEAQRVIDPPRGRYWLVANPGSRTELGHESAYTLVPGQQRPGFQPPRRRGDVGRRIRDQTPLGHPFPA